MNNNYKVQWEQADSLINKGLPQSAEKVVQGILADAKTQNDQPNIIKAKLTLMSLENIHSETSLPDNIKKAAAESEKATSTEKAIWQSIMAGMYWQYYQINRWQILGRSTLKNTVSDDITTWDAKAFVQKTSDLYLASVTAGSLLKKIPVEKYLPLLIEGQNTRNLRPTLYDLLVFRAIDFFSNDEKDVTNPSYKFEIDNPVWFQDAKAFSEVRMKIADANSLHYKALQLYQDIIAFHLDDAQPDALIDADLHRLQFVYDNSVSPDKDSLYLTALKKIADKYDGNPGVAQVLFLIQQQLYNNNADKNNAQSDTAYYKRNLPIIKKNLQQIINKYPNTEGAANASNLLPSIDQKTLSIDMEKVVMPDENLKVLISHKNVDTVYFHLYKVAFTDSLFNNAPSYYNVDTAFLKKLNNRIVLKSWDQPLPLSNDMELHKVEAKINPLPVGAYILVVSNEKDIKSQQTVSGYATFTVSNIALITSDYGNRETVATVINRKTGRPESKAVAHFYGDRYNAKTDREECENIGNLHANANGEIKLSSRPSFYDNYFNKVYLCKGNDTLSLKYFDYHEPEHNNIPVINRQVISTFFFTDRSIYRPGQTIYFKGIMVRNDPHSGTSEVVANENTEVVFYDVNGQKITSSHFTTNEFGSFSGTFVAPDGLLTGQMYINNGSGRADFNVEEYKRPKFYIEFDTLKDNYSLNQTVKVKGSAKAYAGNNIDGATVKYRVVRNAKFPYYWCYYRCGMPSSPQMEITNGTTITRPDGSFEISFKTLPDKKTNPQSLPVFSYRVYVDITDINGETHSENITLNAGYRNLKINIDIPEDAAPKNLDSIKITTKNLNDVFVPANVMLSIARLQFPGKLYKERLWDMPDQFLMTESQFHTLFPDDEYKNESDYHNWKEEKPIYEKSFVTTTNGNIKVPLETWKHNGWYVITIKTKDLKGNEVTEKEYTHIWDPYNTENIQKDFVLQTEKSTYKPGEKAVLKVAMGFDDPYLIYVSSLNDYNINNYKLPIVFEKNITENDRGAIGFSYLFVHNNRVYTAGKTIAVPWDNKDLQIEWATHRDKLWPGAQDEWTMTIKGNKKEKVAAELLAGLYDASLDAIKPHFWGYSKFINNGDYEDDDYYNFEWNEYDFGTGMFHILRRWSGSQYSYYSKIYDNFIWPNDFYKYRYYNTAHKESGIINSRMQESPVKAMMAPSSVAVSDISGVQYREPSINENSEGASQETKVIPIRKNLQETAFFFPQLQTDSNGNVTFKFTMPEALTEWKLMAFAHTKDWKTGYLEGKVKTQKDLMVMPNLPRFFRQGDDMVITTKINSLADKDLSGIATLEILNAATLQPMELPFKLQSKEQSFSVAAHQSTTASWNVHIPESVYGPVVVRITARAGNFTDGEESTLPVITNRMLVTETLPLPVRGNEEKTFTLDKLKNATSNTLVNRSLTVEFTGNPAWYAVQALPYLMDYPYECAEQTFNRFYANALAAHIIAQSPKVEAIFNQWKNEDTAALMSNLSKNQELKAALLEETPWVMEAKDETEQKHRIALLFETHKLAKELSKNLNKLEQMQLPEDGFPWFSGMHSDRYITQYIITGLARLQHLGVSLADKTAAQKMINNALPYLDRMLKSDYDDLIKYKAKLDEQHIGYTQIQYLYMRSFYKDIAIDKASQKAFEYYKSQAAKYWSNFNPYMKGMIALASNRLNDSKTANDIIASLKETAVHNDEMGMYWKTMPRGYWWYEAPVEAQSLLIEAFQEVAKDESAVDEMKTWLLKQKQTQNWQTTKATADACYALLLTGSDWLANEPLVTINLGDVKTIHSSDIKTEAGTGYFKQIIDGKEVQPAMGIIKVKIEIPNSKFLNDSLHSHVSNPKSQISWGAVYWQYFEDMDKITAAATPLSVTKELFIERNSDTGPMLTEIKDGNQLQVGDKVKVRIVLKADRDMEYVHLKDMRGACFEPVAVLSGYRYQNGLGYYESTKDVSTNFFFDRINKGTYVLEYTVFVNQKGDFSNGIATAQCMYAPEFSSHTEGIRVKVE